MNICLITGNYSPRICGVGKYTEQLAHQLDKQDVNVTVLTSAYNGTTETNNQVRVLPVMENWKYENRSNLSKYFDQIKPDIIHLQYQIATFQESMLVYTLPLQRIPVVTTFHDYTGPKNMGKLGLGLVLWLLATSRRVIVTHEKPRRTFNKFPSIRSKLVEIPVGCNISRVENVDPSLAAKYLGDRQDPVLTFFGFVWRGKNIEWLIETQRVLLERGVRAQLLIVGEIIDQDYYRDLLELARQKGVEDRICFTGKLEDDMISTLLSRSTICAFPFEHGATTGHGTIIAAIEHEIPIVTTIDPANAFPGFCDRENVLLTPLNGPTAFTEAVHQLLQTPELYEKIKRNTKALASQFAWETLATSHKKIYAEILG